MFTNDHDVTARNGVPGLIDKRSEVVRLVNNTGIDQSLDQFVTGHDVATRNVVPPPCLVFRGKMN